MAQTKKTVSELIQDAFCPTVAVLYTQDVNTICEKNKLTFVQLLQPFCRLPPTEVSYHDPTNNSITLKNFRLDIKDFNSIPTPNTQAKKFLDDAVPCTTTNGLPNSDTVIDTEQYQLRIRSTTPWFDSWRDCFLRLINGGDHEYLKNYVACIMVASTYEIDPVLCFDVLLKQQQQQQQQQSTAKTMKPFMTNIYNYFVLLHDVNDVAESKALSCFDQLKGKYGAGNCHLLQINSKRPEQISADLNEITNMSDPWRLYVKQTPNSQMSIKSDDSISNLADSINQDLNLNTSIAHPLSSYHTSSNDYPSINPNDDAASTVIHGAYLTSSDHGRIHTFIQEFVTRGLLPWVETNLKTFSEQITSRRGITKFFSMPKKFFGGSTSTPKNTPANSTTNLTNDSTEINMLRCAGDLAFLFQNYEFAFSNYYAAKRDLSKEQSPAFYAGILEMCCLSNFMQESTATKPYPAQYMDEAIGTYISPGRLPTFAIRCALMSTEILKSKDMYDQAVQQFIRVSQGDSDLANALFLEQASHCYLHYRPPYIRKYAFYMVIAGNRYLKAKQSAHALRCFKDVLNIYGKPNWSLALDHLNSTLATQSAASKQSVDALLSFNALFAPNNRIQNAQQQINFFKEYLTVFDQLIQSETSLTELPVPLVENSTIKILLAGHQQQPQMGGQVSNCNDFDFDETRDIWSDLERTITAHDRRPSGTRTQMTLFTNRTHNQQHPLAVANETIRIEVSLRNTLQVPLLLSELQVLWKYSTLSWKRKASVSVENDENAREYTNDTLTEQTDQPVECNILNDCVILPNDTSKIELSLRPNRPGYLTILGITYRLNILAPNLSDSSNWPVGIQGKTLFHVKGLRLNSNRKERLNVMYGADKRLEIQVVPEAPLLQIEFSPLPATMFGGEIQSCLLHLINTSSNHTISRVRLATSQPNLIAISSLEEENLLNYIEQSESIYNHSINQSPSVLNLINSHHQLQPNSTQTIRLWLRASHLAGEMNMDFMFVYESDQFQQPLRHRTVKHSALFIITHSIAFQTQAQSTGLGEIILPVQIDNLMPTPNALNIDMQQLSCISKQWTIENLSPIPLNSIRYGENLSLLFKCRQQQQQNEQIQMKHIYLANDSTNQEKYIDVSQNPLSNFFRHFISTIDTKNQSKHRHEPSTIPSISLLLLWQIAVSNQLGQIELRHGLHIISPSIDFLTTQTDLSQMIQYDLNYPSIVEHQFTKSLYLPIELKLSNQTTEKVELQLQLLRSTLDSDPSLSSCCLWSGMTEQYLNLSAHEQLILNLQACFFKPGFYTLGNISLALIDKLNSTLIPIKSNKQNYFIDIRTVPTN